jgi:A/G-specific adenine glycosylase
MHQFQQILAQWYLQNKRDLPWRNTSNPYHIWLSEIILQQTRVDQGMSYYYKFLKEFPTVFELANAEEIEVLRLWQGLGYYSRARNLHASAKIIVEKYNGIFPGSFEEILKLKGVGSYTAAAISSFAYDEPKAVLDGNVYRVLSRLFAVDTPIDSSSGQKEFQELANEMLDTKNPGQHNQAMMEFGALQCIPANPNCAICPLLTLCEARNTDRVKQYPIKKGKTKIKARYFVFEIMINNEGKFYLEQRKQLGIWQNMFQFPLKEFDSLEQKETYLNPNKFHHISDEHKHILSHQHLFCTFAFPIESPETTQNNFIAVTLNELDNYPIPRVIEKFVEENTNLLFVK